MVKRIDVRVPPKGPGLERNSRSIYVNTRVKKLMGSWHPDYNPKLHIFISTFTGLLLWHVVTKNGLLGGTMD